MKRARFSFLSILSLSSLASLVFLMSLCLYSFPEVDKAFPYSKVLYGKDKQVLASLIAKDAQWRYKLATKDVPKKLKQSILTFEDKRFFSHFGIDFLALMRAMRINLLAGKVVSGGSTITMQLGRMLYRNRSRSFSQKMLEMIYSLYLELIYSKEEILNFYVSFAPYGGNIVGAETASWFYFKRPLGSITWAESALLAVLPNNPANIHINKNRELLLIKRNKLLRKLYNIGKIDNTDLRLSLEETLPKLIQRPSNLAATLLSTTIKKYPEQDNYLSTLSTETQTQLVKTTSFSLQGLADYRIANLAVIVIDNETNEVIAYDGNAYSKGLDRNLGYLDLARRARSTGSILKPFLYAELLDQGMISPSSLISDIPTYYEGFKPKNFVNDYSGVVPANLALARSLNIPAARMLKKIGTSQFYDLLQELNFKNINRGVDNYGLSIILGGAEENLWRITNAYSQMATVVMGMQQDIVQTRWLLTQKSIKRDFPLSIGASYLTLKALLEVNRPGNLGHWKSFASSQKISWKTGTSQGFKDSWAVGVSGRYTVGVWAGNANGAGNPNLIGVKIAAPVMFRVFNFLPRSKWLSKPAYEIKEVAVCKKSGYRAHSGCPVRLESIPGESNFQELDTFYQSYHLDESEKYRVNSSCYPTDKMKKKIQFILAPVESYYYQRSNIAYSHLPKWLAGCEHLGLKKKNLSILYPPRNVQIYLPHGLDGEKNKVVLKAAHSSYRAKLFWHLNDEFLGESIFEHNKEVLLKPGKYQLMITDELGEVKISSFAVLENE